MPLISGIYFFVVSQITDHFTYSRALIKINNTRVLEVSKNFVSTLCYMRILLSRQYRL